MHDAAIIEAVRRHAVPVDLETAAQRLLDADRSERVDGAHW